MVAVQDPLEAVRAKAKAAIEARQAETRPVRIKAQNAVTDASIAKDRQVKGLIGVSDLDDVEGPITTGPTGFPEAEAHRTSANIAKRLEALNAQDWKETEEDLKRLGAAIDAHAARGPGRPQYRLGEGGQIEINPLEQAFRETEQARLELKQQRSLRLPGAIAKSATGVLTGAPFGPVGGIIGGAIPAAEYAFGQEPADPLTLTTSDLLLKQAEKGFVAPDGALVDILAMVASTAGGLGAARLAQPLATALKLKQGLLATRGEMLARGGLSSTMFGLGAGTTGGAAYAAMTGRNILETAGRDALLAGGVMGVTSFGIPLGFAGLARMSSAVGRPVDRALRAIGWKDPNRLPEAYDALEQNMAKAAFEAVETGAIRGEEFLRLRPDQIAAVRKSAERMRLPVEEYASVLDDVAFEQALYPDGPLNFAHTVEKALMRAGDRLGRQRFVPDWASELPDPLNVPENVYAFKATEALAKGLSPFYRWMGKVGDRMGFAPGMANQAARDYLREYKGERRYWSDVARRDLLVNWSKMSPEERERAGKLFHGYIKGAAVREGGPLTPEAQIEFEARLPGMTPKEGRGLLLRAMGREIAEEGPLTLPESLSAYRGDPLLTAPGKDTLVLARRINNEMEKMLQEHPELAHVWGQGLYRNRAWITKEVMDAIQRQDFQAFQARLLDPSDVAIQGAARLKRDVRILEVDQRMGGAWGIRNTKTGELLGDRFTDPNEAGRAVAKGREAGKPWRVEDPITWREAMEGTTAAGKLISADVVPDAVRLSELANDLAINRLMSDVAGNPKLTMDYAGTVPKGWMAIPGGDDAKRRFGPLAGKLVRKNIGEHILDVGNADSTKWDKIMQGWVWSRLGTSSGTHFRNMYWDSIALDHPSIGLSPWKSMPYLGEAAEIYANQDPLYRFAVRRGLIGGEFTETVHRIWKDHLAKLVDGGEKDGWKWWEAVKDDLSASSRTYGSEDQIFALAGWLKLMREDHLSPLTALNRVKEAFSDFRLMRKTWPVFGGEIGRGKLQNPFVRFDVEQLRIFNNAMKHGPAGPLWFAKWYGLYPALMTAASLKATGLTFDEFAEMQRGSPKWRANDIWTMVIPVPETDKDGRKRYGTVSLGSALPFLSQKGDVRLEAMFENEDASFPMRLGFGTASRLFSNPLTMAIVSSLKGLNVFTGADVRKPGEELFWARGREFLQGAAPIPGTFPGMYWEKKFRDAAEGRPAGTRVTYPQYLREVMPRMFGFTYQVRDPELEAEAFDAQMGGEWALLRREERAIEIEHDAGKTTDPEYRRKIRNVHERMANQEEREAKKRPKATETLLRPFLAPGKEK